MDNNIIQNLLNGMTPQIGLEWYLDPVNGDNTNDGTAYNKAFKTFSFAYDKLTANKNETLYLIGGASAIPVVTALTWGKDYTHFIGLSAGGPYGRSRLNSASAPATVVDVFTITAKGCIFKNIHWQLEGDHAEQLNCVVLSALACYNYFENCHFDSPLSAEAGQGAYNCLVMTSFARSNTFRGCWFGGWTAAPTASTGNIIDFGGVNAGTQFIDCTFIINTDEDTMIPMKFAADLGGGNPPGYVSFQNCDFLAMSTAVLAVFTPPTTGKIVLMNCRAVGCAEWAASGSACLLISCGPACVNEGGLGVAETGS